MVIGFVEAFHAPMGQQILIIQCNPPRLSDQSEAPSLSLSSTCGYASSLLRAYFNLTPVSCPWAWWMQENTCLHAKFSPCYKYSFMTPGIFLTQNGPSLSTIELAGTVLGPASAKIYWQTVIIHVLKLVIFLWLVAWTSLGIILYMQEKPWTWYASTESINVWYHSG